ncbi:MAG: carboxymuconolactone decarboxylase family protein [bacterium]
MDYTEIRSSVQKRMGRLGEGIPETMGGFQELHEASVADGALSTKTKELIALAIGVTVRCDGCIAYHVKEALDAGASREEILETLGVTILMGGGPGVVYASEAMEAAEQFMDEEGKQGHA